MVDAKECSTLTCAFTVSCCFVGPVNRGPWRCYRGICFADPSDSRIICFADLPTSEPRTNYEVLLDSKDSVHMSSWPGRGAVACVTPLAPLRKITA